MLKMFHRRAVAGGAAGFWREVWDEAALSDALRFCESDPLRPLMARHTRPGQTMLEGGCGRGQYVAYHASRGVRVVGIDFEKDALTDAKACRPDLWLCAGDVSTLPLGDSSVDVYYSGGVVEHFEEGPGTALREARRVLRDKAVLLVSVPYHSPLRRLLKWGGRPDWRVVTAPKEGPSPPDMTFFQYAFTPGEFGTFLKDAGFEVVSTRGYAVLWGLMEIPGSGVLARLSRGLRERRSHRKNDRGPYVKGSAAASRPASFWKRLLVSEDADIPGLGWLVRLMRWSSANMMMYVCVRREAKLAESPD